VRSSMARSSARCIRSRARISDWPARICGLPARARCEVIASSPLAGWGNLDGALARYAFLLEVTHRPENLRIYRRLVTEFPHSPHALRAHLVLGEADRVAKRMTAAYAHFAEAAQPQHPRTIRAYAMYRLGWIELEDRGQGAYAFRLFMHSIAIEPTGLLALELRHGITKSFALFGNPAEAFSTFARVQPDDALEMANELAERLRENHRAVDAVGVLDELVRRAPGDIRACTWQAEATRGALALGDDMLFFRQAERLTQIFERIRHLAVKPDLIEECEAAVVTYTLDAAQTKNTALQRALRDLFVRAFPERAAAAIKRFAPVAPAELAN